MRGDDDRGFFFFFFPKKGKEEGSGGGRITVNGESVNMKNERRRKIKITYLTHLIQ